jgi:hypothetical protein
MTVFKFSLFKPFKFDSFEVVAAIFEKYFNKTELQGMILKSNEFFDSHDSVRRQKVV